MNRNRNLLRIFLVLFAVFSCHLAKKQSSVLDDITPKYLYTKDLSTILDLVRRYHVFGRKINYSLGFSEAIRKACDGFDGRVQIFPTGELGNNGGEVIFTNKIFSIAAIEDSGNDSGKSIAVEKIISNQKRKKAIKDLFARNSFSQMDLENVLHSLDEYVTKRKSKQDRLIDIESIQLLANIGFIESLDPHSLMIDINRKEPRLPFQIVKDKNDRNLLIRSRELSEANAEIKDFDEIISVNGRNIDMPEFLNRNQQSKGNQENVDLEVLRNGKDLFQISYKFSNRDLPNIEGRILLGSTNLFYIKLRNFNRIENSPTVEDSFKTLLSNLKKEASYQKLPVKGLIIDIRNNPGGYLDAVIGLADLLVPKGVAIFTSRYTNSMTEIKSEKDMITDLPIAVLVNSQTSSGAEIFAGVIQNEKRGIVLGERTFGSGTIQKLFPLQERKDFILKLTTSFIVIGSEATFHLKGIVPDFAVSEFENGDFPAVLREEDHWNYISFQLSEIPKEESTINSSFVENWVKKNGVAPKTITESLKKGSRPDFLLLRSIDIFNGYLVQGQ